MNEIKIRVVGIPAAQGSKTLTRYGAMIESSKKVRPWRQDVKQASLQSYKSIPLNMPVKATLEFVFNRPKSHYGTGKNATLLKPSAPNYCVSRGRGDIDKLGRSTLDGLSVSAGGTVLEDDCLVTELSSLKRYANYGELGGAYITIQTLQ